MNAGNIPLRAGQVWKYRGNDGTPYLNHTITEVSSEGVCTFSDFMPDAIADVAGPNAKLEDGSACSSFSWFGSLADFIQQFQPVKI